MCDTSIVLQCIGKTALQLSWRGSISMPQLNPQLVMVAPQMSHDCLSSVNGTCMIPLAALLMQARALIEPAGLVKQLAL